MEAKKKKSLTRKAVEVCGTIVAATAILMATAPESFVNAIGWVPVSTIPADNYYAIQSQSVAKGIQILPDPVSGLNFQYRCTWWSVDQANRIMMANGHCYNEKVVKMGRQKHPFVMTFPNGTKAECDDVIAYSPWEGLDYMAVKCKDAIPPALKIDMKTILKKEDKLVHISWNCDYVEEGVTGDENCAIVPMIDFTSDCRVQNPIYRGGVDFTQGCDSLGGSSGSPVHLEENGLVIGLHHSGHFYAGSEKFGAFNGSVHIRKVVQDIREKGIQINFHTNEEGIKPPSEEPIKDPVDVDGKVPTEELSFLDLLLLIFDALSRFFSK